MTTDEYSDMDEYSHVSDLAGGRDITCIMCGDIFNLREGEQDFFAQRGLDLPKRCPVCRAERKAQTVGGGAGRMDPGAIPQRHHTSSKVECSHCNRLTVVPFTPRVNSEVYCRICWEGIKNVGTTGAVYV